MYCTNPNFIWGKGFIPCRKCQACTIAKKKEWADRLIIESTYWPYKYFVSMTYAPENLPEDLSLRPQDMIDWKKRLGYYFGRVPQLYYCGEYGDCGDLPHYHAIVFCDEDGFEKILKSWTLGRISVDNCTPERCAYCTGYCTEKLDKPERTDGRQPEFHGASRKPPLGYRLMYEILEKMAKDDGFRERILRHVYPPYSVSIGGKNIRLPPYIRNKLRYIWKEYNEEKQKAFIAQKNFEAKLVLSKIKENLQKLHVLEPDEKPFEFENLKGEKVSVAPRMPTWKHMKFKARELYESLEQRNRKGYNIKHRRL